MSSDAPVLLFDGYCNLCNGSVNFILDRERGSSLRFASLQSETAAELLARIVGEDQATKLRAGTTGDGSPDTMIFVDSGRLYTHSAGILRVAKYLRAPWSWGSVFLIVPRFLRDAVYRLVSRHRYRWFGKSDVCRVPTPELRARFLG